MKTKNLMVSFIAIVTLLALTSVIAAKDITTNYDVTVEGIYAYYNDVSVVAGEDITVKVYFTSDVSDTDVTIEAELEGDKVDTKDVSEVFDVEENMTYRKVLTLKVPFELKDIRSDDLTLSITIDGKNYRTELEDIALRVQRPSYNAVIKSVVTLQNIDAGETIPVDIVLKNVGYNDLDDLYVSVSIPALGIEKTGYFGDLVAIEDEDCTHCNDDDDTDTVSGRVYLEVPFGVKSGVYSLEVEVSNDDTTSREVKQVTINNEFSSGTVIVTSTSKSVSVGEEAEYSILIVNPTDQMKVYRIVTENTGGLTSSTNEAVIAISAGSSKTVKVTAIANTEGDYNFNVNIFSGSDLLEKVALTTNVKGTTTTQITSPIVVLTIILAIVFVVLLIVLIVLLGKRPEKSEEFGESYY